MESIKSKFLRNFQRGVKCVSDLEDFLELSQPNLSHHLAILTQYEVIDYYIDGRLRCYFLKDPFALGILEVLKKDYREEVPLPECCPIIKKGKYPGKRGVKK